MLQSKARLQELNARLAETLTNKGVAATANETTTALIDKVKNISGSDKLIEFNQVRDEVQDYLDNVTYDPTDYTTSEISNYVTDTSNNQPVGCTINLKSAGTLIVYDSANGGSAVTNSVAGDNYIYNVTPNAVCHYVNIVDGNIEQSGTLKATGQMRMIKSATAHNVRDLGGWNCDGGTVKYGKLFRGGEVSSKDIPILVDFLGIKHDINLRGKSEATWIVSPLGEDVKFHIYDDYAWYSIINSELLKSILEDIFYCVLNDEPAYFHCSAGADRTGTVAFILESILGMSQSDMDKDYELTCFYSGVDTDLKARRRNESEWTGLVNSFSDYAGDTFRDKVVSWVLSLGIPIDVINKFRSKMIDGTPKVLSFSGNTYSISTNIDNVSLNNSETEVQQYSNYEAEITPNEGYIISNISVVMDGQDITSSVFKGTKANFNFSVTNTLLNCSTNNTRRAVISGQSYGETITADYGYSLENADISIKMGGIEMSSQYYSNGTIIIPKVTGNIEINITAKESASTYTNLADKTSAEWLTGKRINSSNTVVDATGWDCTNFINCQKNDTLYIKNIDITSAVGGANNGRVAIYTDKDTCIATCNPHNQTTFFATSNDGVIQFDILSYINSIKGSVPAAENMTYVRLVCISDPTKPIITVNEEIS